MWLVSLLAMVLGLGLAALFLPAFNSFTGQHLELFMVGDIGLIVCLLPVALIVGLLAGIYPASPKYLTNVGGTLFFQAYDPTHGYELWKTNGTAAGTALVKDLKPGPASSYPFDLTVLNGKVYFVTSTSTAGAGEELWATNGTAAGTLAVKSFAGSVSSMTAYDGKLMLLVSAGGGSGNTTAGALWSSTNGSAPAAIPSTTVSARRRGG